MKASDLFVKCLEEEGIEYIFGVPGEENADFMISLEKSDKIQFILTRHEQGAAFMAAFIERHQEYMCASRTAVEPRIEIQTAHTKAAETPGLACARGDQKQPGFRYIDHLEIFTG